MHRFALVFAIAFSSSASGQTKRETFGWDDFPTPTILRAKAIQRAAILNRFMHHNFREEVKVTRIDRGLGGKHVAVLMQIAADQCNSVRAAWLSTLCFS